jgi:hypothetical protein
MPDAAVATRYHGCGHIDIVDVDTWVLSKEEDSTNTTRMMTGDDEY